MSFRILSVLYRKEILDLLRDRRTLISLIIAPVLIGPVVSAGMGYFMERSRRQAKVERYKVGLSEQVVIPGLRDSLTAAALEVRDAAAPRAAVENKEVTFGIEVTGTQERPNIRFYSDNSEMVVNMARARVNEVLDGLSKQRIRAELAKHNVPESVLEPFNRESINIAQPRKMAGNIVGTMIGFLLLIFLFNGGMYAAVDATAGEKERRTLEMLLASAAGRTEIVLAKVGAALTTAFATTVLSLASYAVAFSRMRGRDAQAFLAFPTDIGSLLMLALLILPVAIMASAVSVGAAIRAKSTREAMSYLTPGFLIVLLLGW
jgi:sodium transport system permease protein